MALNEFQEKWADDTLYVYQRGHFIVATTNDVNGNVHVDVPNIDNVYEGEEWCNIFVKTDCAKIENGKLPVYLNYGEQKVFIPSDSSFWN